MNSRMTDISDENGTYRGLVETYWADLTMFNEQLALRPDGYQRLALSTISSYFAEQSMDSRSLQAAFGLRWVLLSMTVDIKAPILPEEELISESWASGREDYLFRMETALKRVSGETVAVIAKYYGLMDSARRRLTKDISCINSSPLDFGPRVLEAASRPSWEEADYEEAGVWMIPASWIDLLGHTNNIHYGELSYNALPEGRQASIDRLRRMEIYFTGELKKGEGVQLFLSHSEETDTVKGVRMRDGKQSFLCRMVF